MVIRYLILEANPVPLAYLAGFISFFLGLFWSLAVAIEALGAKAQATEVTAASILFVGGSILLVLAVVLDVLFSSMRNQRRPASHLDHNR
jgi:hypothetical protein